jgi:type IV pilus assembly protein PilV
VRQAQQGSFLLEALVAVLIVAFGVLGLLGLHARSIQHVEDAQYRAEAAYLASALVGQMWVDVKDPALLQAKYEDSGSGAGYTEFKAMVDQRLPGASLAGNDPTVTFIPPAAPPAVQSPQVAITIFWQPPGETAPHRYQITTRIGKN